MTARSVFGIEENLADGSAAGRKQLVAGTIENGRQGIRHIGVKGQGAGQDVVENFRGRAAGSIVLGAPAALHPN